MAEGLRVRPEGTASEGKRLDGGDRGLENGDRVGAEAIEDPVQ